MSRQLYIVLFFINLMLFLEGVLVNDPFGLTVGLADMVLFGLLILLSRPKAERIHTASE